MRHRLLASWFLLAPLACSAGVDEGGGGSDTRSGPSGTGQSTGQGGSTFTTYVGGSGGSGGMIMDPCGTKCGPVELCDGQNRGLDDDCDGAVDEDCLCGPGEASSCFKGDPSYLDNTGCFPGAMGCTENGTWGPCTGGSHATDLCFQGDPLGCHPISAVPFQTVDLKTGTGTFDDDAMTETFDVTCPMGVSPCPSAMGSSFQPLQSGEYTVTYTKTVNSQTSQCVFPLYVGARGLRVELTWNYPAGFDSTDLDLHLHEPETTTPWATSGAPQDCGFANCKAFNFLFPFGNEPHWFPDGNTPPAPVNWYDAPNDQEDLCYYAPQMAGQEWQTGGMGCHSPRLDLDNISCDPAVTDPNSFSFCAPENINIDFPPKEQWMRIAVHYYPGTSSYLGTTYPNVKIFCEGKPAAELGAFGFHDPEMPVSWSGSTDQDKMWIVADVLFRADQCNNQCYVQPIYANEATKTPLIVPASQAQTTFAPPYPPPPP